VGAPLGEASRCD